MQKSHLLIFLSSILLTACTTPLIHQPLSAAARGDLASTEVVTPIRQSEIYVFVPTEQGGASHGLIGVLIDAGIDAVRTSKAETAVAPLRNAMVDFNFDTALQAELKNSLAKIEWLHPVNFQIEHDVSDQGIERTLTDSKTASVLFVIADYHLSNDGDVLLASFDAALMPNNDQLRALIPGKRDTKRPIARENALYQNRFAFEAHVSGTDDRDRNIAEWSANNAAAARAALEMATRKFADMLKEDLQRPEEDVAPPSNVPVFKVDVPAESAECRYQPAEAQCGTTGVLQSQEEGGETFRFKDGSLKYVKLGAF